MLTEGNKIVSIKTSFISYLKIIFFSQTLNKKIMQRMQLFSLDHDQHKVITFLDNSMK